VKGAISLMFVNNDVAVISTLLLVIPCLLLLIINFFNAHVFKLPFELRVCILNVLLAFAARLIISLHLLGVCLQGLVCFVGAILLGFLEQVDQLHLI